jgi:alpha-tubulin suppressor-like RCC1 family protein
MGDALKPIALGTGRKAIGVSAGNGYTCALLDDGTVKCWGDNGVGQLGTEAFANSQAPDPVASVKLGRKAKAVSTSADGVTCALLDDGTLKCWGNVWYVTHADYAELGGAPGIGDFAGEISGLPALTFSGASPAQSVIAGRVSAVLLGDGSVRIWGTTSDGQFGHGLSYLGLTPTELVTVEPVYVGIGRTAKGVALGATHACVLLDDGQIKCWAGNDEGQLGLGNMGAINGPPGSIDPVYLGGHSGVQVAAGKSHTCAILDDGTLKCWGSNSAGQLGLGDLKNRGGSGGKLSADTTVDLVF